MRKPEKPPRDAGTGGKPRSAGKACNPPRLAALQVLLRCEKQKAWSDAALGDAVRANGLDARDAALASRLCYGVQQNLLLLDFWLAGLSNLPLEKLEPPLRNALRLGLYQLTLLDRVPERAAVDETVKLCHACCKSPNSARIANGILRSACRNRSLLALPENLSVRYSHPQWLVDLLSGELAAEPGSGELEALLRANNAEAPLTVQVNPLRTDEKTLLAALRKEGAEAEKHPWLPGCLTLRKTGNPEALPSFQRGDFYVQDAAARLAVLAAAPKPGMRVLDCCAAPGGKSFAAALALENRGSILACDLHPGKLKLVRQGAKRLGISVISTEARDGRVFAPELKEQFDLVLADVPCSGLGIIRKKPDIRYKEPDALAGLPAVQTAILDNVSRYVKPGGVLLYATCTVLRRENRAVVEGFLARHGDFSPEAFTLPEPLGCVKEGMLTLWPQLHGTDGFFFAKLRRKEGGA